MTSQTINPSSGLANVRYEIRGNLNRRAQEMERMGYDIVMLNIGNPGAFGFRTPEAMRLAMLENLRLSEGYCHQKGIFPAREAVVMLQQNRGVRGVTAEEVVIGNGVSELIDLTLRGLLNTDDEVLVPSPDYPLWTAAVNLNTGRAVHYPCHPAQGFVPNPADIAALITKRTRAIVIVNICGTTLDLNGVGTTLASLTVTQCGTADFNNDGDSGTDQDIEAFFRCLAGNCCAQCGSADFNGDGDTGTDQDIEAFFRVLAGGHC